MSRVEEIRRRLEAATPGPWRAVPKNVIALSWAVDSDTTSVAHDLRRFDAELIAHAPDDLAYLLSMTTNRRKGKRNLFANGHGTKCAWVYKDGMLCGESRALSYSVPGEHGLIEYNACRKHGERIMRFLRMGIDPAGYWSLTQRMYDEQHPKEAS